MYYSKEEEIKNICENKYDFFINRENVVGIGFGNKISNHIDTNERCIQIFVSKKQKVTELYPNDVIEPFFEGFKTDVMEIGEIYAEPLTAKVRPAILGYSISPSSLLVSGTAGVLTTNGDDYFILSNNHVLAGENTLTLNTPIIQPGRLDGGVYPNDTIATLAKYIPIVFETTRVSSINYVDCALAKIISKDKIKSLIALCGYVKGISKPLINLPVKKIGRTTDLTTGLIKSTNATVRVIYSGGKTALFKNQIICTRMSMAGDSGSLLLNNSNYAIGLLFAGSNSTTIFNPIDMVLKKLGVELVTIKWNFNKVE